jgi:hypothetical protein
MKLWFTKTASNENETDEFDIIDNEVDPEKETLSCEKKDTGSDKVEGGYRQRVCAYTNYLNTLLLDSFPEYRENYGSCYQQWRIKTTDFINVTKSEVTEVWNGLKQQNMQELLQAKPKSQNGYYNETGL